MPHNNNDPWPIRRIHIIFAVWAPLWAVTIAPVFFLGLTVLEFAIWATVAAWGCFYIAVQAARPDWRCALPQPLRALFWRQLEHPWKETRRVDWYVEQYCERCEQYRHGKMTAYDAVEAWIEGRLPGAS